MLESVKRAYEKGAFDEDENQCPYDLKTIEMYHQILAPAYRVSLGFQKNSTSIAETIPYVLILIEKWKSLVLPLEPTKLCQLLISCLKSKFHCELNSPTYQVLIFCSKMFLS